jgi:hypothetical protein
VDDQGKAIGALLASQDGDPADTFPRCEILQGYEQEGSPSWEEFHEFHSDEDDSFCDDDKKNDKKNDPTLETNSKQTISFLKKNVNLHPVNSLMNLNLDRSKIGMAGAVEIATGLKKNTRLLSLDLTFNSIASGA